MESLIPFIALLFVGGVLCLTAWAAKASLKARDNQYKAEYRRQRRLQDEVDRETRDGGW